MILLFTFGSSFKKKFGFKAMLINKKRSRRCRCFVIRTIMCFVVHTNKIERRYSIAGFSVRRYQIEINLVIRFYWHLKYFLLLTKICIYFWSLKYFYISGRLGANMKAWWWFNWIVASEFIFICLWEEYKQLSLLEIYFYQSHCHCVWYMNANFKHYDQRLGF